MAGSSLTGGGAGRFRVLIVGGGSECGRADALRANGIVRLGREKDAKEKGATSKEIVRGKRVRVRKKRV